MGPALLFTRAGVLGLALAACAPDPNAATGVAGMRDIDPFVRDRIDAAQAACERNEAGALLELAKVYDANGLTELAYTTYEQCLASETNTPESKDRRAKQHFYVGK